MDPHSPEAVYAKATKAELAANYDAAFKLYVHATELFLHLSRTEHHSEVIRTKCKASAAKALERAEKIKAFLRKTPPQSAATATVAPAPDVRLTPIGINHFSEQEQYYVLRRGSRINGLSFPLWDDPPTSTSDFNDPADQPPLSPEQRRVSAAWLRPRDLTYSWHSEENELLPQEIIQHIVTDCSVCASVSVCLEHGRRFGTNLARSSIHNTTPLEGRLGSSLSLDNRRLSATGRYDVKIFVNGAWRRTVIDDKLPYDTSSGMLMCMSVCPDDAGDSKHVYWPSFLEKSYMKLMGGYDFPGSNSSIDLHAFTGWIPEQIDTKSSSFEREKLWQRLLTGFKNGQCVVTLGTGQRPGIQWRGVQLLESHSYAVIDIIETEEDRFFTVLDSWVQTEDERPRLLRIPWCEVIYVFDGIYLSWDPQQWKHHITFHGMWKRGGQEDEDVNHNLNINFVNANSETEEIVWILLTRHITNTKRTNDFICLRAEVEDATLSQLLNNNNTNTGTSGTSALQHQQIRQRINIRSSSPFSSTSTSSAPPNNIGSGGGGVFTNSTHTLVRVGVNSGCRSGVISVIASYESENGREEEDVRDGGVGFSVCVYSSENIELGWDEGVFCPPFSNKIQGTLTSKNSGGNCAYPTFMVNPQYHLRIHPPASNNSSTSASNQYGKSKKSRTKMVLKTSREVPINLVVVWSNGCERKFELVEKEVAATSGAYTYGFAQLIKDLTPGDYTIIVSAFEPHYIGSYTLRIESENPFDLNNVPQEGAGMYSKVVKGSWVDGVNAMGGPRFMKYDLNPRFLVDVGMAAQIKVRLQLINSTTKVTSTSLNVTIFHSPFTTSTSTSTSSTSSTRNTSTSPLGEKNKNGMVTTSGAYDSCLAGVVTPQVTLSKGKYEIVPSTYSPGVEAEFRLVVYSSVSGLEVKRIQ